MLCAHMFEKKNTISLFIRKMKRRPLLAVYHYFYVCLYVGQSFINGSPEIRWIPSLNNLWSCLRVCVYMWVIVQNLPLSVCQRLHLFLCKTLFYSLLYIFCPLPMQANTLTCPGVLNRLQPAPGELVRSDKTRLHQSLTRLALSFRSHGSLCYCLIQTDSRTLGYFPLCIFWISQRDTMDSPSVWCKSTVYTCPSTWMACVRGLWVQTWKHTED